VASPDSDNVFDQTESSRAETVSREGTSVETATPVGPRYSKRGIRHLSQLVS
jgi:hypothetical protein